MLNNWGTEKSRRLLSIMVIGQNKKYDGELPLEFEDYNNLKLKMAEKYGQMEIRQPNELFRDFGQSLEISYLGRCLETVHKRLDNLIFNRAMLSRFT